MIEVARALRKLGVLRLDVRADGFTADFAPVTSKPAKVSAQLSFGDTDMPDAVNNNLRSISTEALERLYAERLAEYEP